MAVASTVLVLVIGVVLAGLLALAQRDAGRERLARWLAPVLSAATGYRVEIVGIGLGLPSRITIGGLTLADSRGVWLTLDGLWLNWRPAELLQGRLAIGAIRVEHLEIARLPAAEEPGTERKTRTEFAIPQPPLDLRIDRLVIDALLISQGVLGEAARLRMEGRFAARVGDVINTDATIVRTDGQEGWVSADVRLDPTTRRLHVQAIASEADNGLIVRALDLAPYPAVRLRLNGDGPFDDWRGSIEAEADGLASLSGDLGAAATATGYRVGFDGRARWNGQMPAVLRPAIEPGLRIAIRSEVAANGPLIVDTLRLDARDLILVASGRLDPATSALAGEANLAVGPGALAPEALAGYRLEGLDAEAVASGRLDAIQLAAAGTVSRLSGPGLKSANLDWQASLAPPVAGGRSLRMSVDATALSAADPHLSTLIGPALSAQVEGRLSTSESTIDLQTARLTLQAGTVTSSGRLALNDAASELRLEAILADLASLQPLLGTAGRGEVRVVAQVQGPLLTGAGEARIEGAAKNLQTGIAVADAALGPSPVLAGDVSLAPGEGLVISGLRVNGANSQISGEGRTDPTYRSFTAGARATVPDLATLARAAGAEAAGTLRLEASGSGLLTDPDAQARMSLTKATIAGIGVETGEIVGAAMHLGSRPVGDVRVMLRTGEGPAEAATRFTVEDGRLLLTGMSATAFGMHATGDAGMDMASGLWQGQVEAAMPTSARIPFGGSNLRGRADARIRLMPIGGRQSADARLQGTSLSFADAGGEAVRIGELEASVRVFDAFGAGWIDENAQASAIRIGGAGPLSLAVRASGPREAIDARIEVDGPKDLLDQLAASIHLDLTGGGAAMTVTSLNGAVGGSRLALAAPLRAVSGAGRLLIDDLDLRVGAGRLAGRLDLSVGTTAGALHLEAVPLPILRGWLPGAPTTGTLSGSGGVSTVGGIVRGELKLFLDDLSFGPAAGGTSPAIDADVQTNFGPAGMDLGITARDAGGPAAPPLLAANLALPVRLVPGSLNIQRSPEAALAGDLQIRADLARLAEAFGLSDQRLGGRLAGDLRLAGSLSRPELLGKTTIRDGIYENFVTGTLISGIAAGADLSEGRTARITLSGTAAGGGSIAADGRVDLSIDGAPAAEISMEARDARLVARDDVTATIGGRLTFRGGSNGGQLAGALAITPVEIRLRDRLPPSVVALPVIEVNRPAGEVSPAPARSASAFVAALDIEVDMPRRVFVRGRGLESEWAGGLRMGGTTATPTLMGEIRVVRGDFTFASKRLRLRKGVVSFAGGPIIDPLLDVAAEYQTPELTAVIAVTGPVSEPVLGVSSQPPLPESEVLAQLMFGKSSTRLSALEAVQLAAALDSLSRGDTFTADALGSIRQFLGLDVLNVDAGGADRGPSLEVGRYFGEHIFVGARRGLADQTSGGRVEVEIVPGLSLQSDILQDVEGTSGSIGLQFKHDY